MDIAITHHVRGAHHGQMDCTLLLSELGSPAAHLHYSEYEGIPHIQMIEVAEVKRRRGHAFRLLESLQTRFPDQEVEWGSLTPDGAALKAACPVKLVETSHAPQFARLARLSSRLENMTADISRLSSEGKCTRAAITSYYCLENRVDELAWQLRDRRAYLSIIDLEPERLPLSAAA